MQELKEKNMVYPCFCTDDELAAMKRAAEAANLPPVYNGKWARASEEQVQAEMDAGTPFCYRQAATSTPCQLASYLLVPLRFCRALAPVRLHLALCRAINL
jgi:glutamyl/glutaminyl-tRNA synthetase